MRSTFDSLNFQRDLDILYKTAFSYILINVRLGLSKKILLSYKIDNISSGKSNEMKDLGIIFDTTFYFICRINFVVSKTYSNFEKILIGVPVFTSLYFAHGRSYLEYPKLVCNPIYDVHI